MELLLDESREDRRSGLARVVSHVDIGVVGLVAVEDHLSGHVDSTVTGHELRGWRVHGAGQVEYPAAGTEGLAAASRVHVNDHPSPLPGAHCLEGDLAVVGAHRPAPGAAGASRVVAGRQENDDAGACAGFVNVEIPCTDATASEDVDTSRKVPAAGPGRVEVGVVGRHEVL